MDVIGREDEQERNEQRRRMRRSRRGMEWRGRGGKGEGLRRQWGDVATGCGCNNGNVVRRASPPRDVEGARATTREAGQEEEKGEGGREKGGGPRAPPRSSEV